MNDAGEPKNLQELLDRLKKNPLFKFVPRQEEPLKDPWNVKSRLLIDDDEAEAIVASLLENECTSPHQGEKCDNPSIPCQRMWAFIHPYLPKKGETSLKLYIKLSSKIKEDKRTGKKEIIIVYVISFHEDKNEGEHWL